MASYDVAGVVFGWPSTEEEYVLPDGSRVFWTGGRAVQVDTVKTRVESAYGFGA